MFVSMGANSQASSTPLSVEPTFDFMFLITAGERVQIDGMPGIADRFVGRMGF